MTDGEVVETTLEDGTLLRLRPVRPDDKTRLAEGVRRLSSRSRYFRFMGAVDELSEKTLRYLTEVDHADHEAWIALDARAPGQPALGVARYVRVRDEPTVAEVAAVVADEWQGRGIAKRLLERLAASAERNGIRTFRAVVLRDNETVLHALAELGVGGRVEEDVVCVEVPVAEVKHLPRPD